MARVTSLKGNLTVYLEFDAGVQWLKEQKYDAIVFAVGTKAATPCLTGIEDIRTVQATELLCRQKLPVEANNVVVIGGGVVGCETAYWPVTRKGGP